MKKTILISVIALAVLAGAAFAHCGKCPGDKKAESVKAEKKDCGDCPMHKKAAAAKKGGHNCPDSKEGGHGGKMCPEKLTGVETASKNIENGVEITMKAGDAETIAKVQELAIVHYSAKDTMSKNCPGRVEGAESKIENTAEGIKVFVTGKTPAVVKLIQEASAREHGGPVKAGKKAGAKKEAKAAVKYMCAMKCVEADKPGKCPKCGMPMQEKK